MSTKQKTIRCANTDADGPISRLQPFKAYGRFSGEVHSGGGYYGSLGDLPFDQTLFGATYVVYSYATPIAWVIDGVWHMPRVHYSSTTQRHQSTTRAGIRKSGLPTTAEGTHAVVAEYKTQRGADRFASTRQVWDSETGGTKPDPKTYTVVEHDGLYLVVRPWERGDMGLHRGLSPSLQVATG